ncbi:MAG: SpoIID/LytB domain-containing protein [Terriglobia bacterium]
MLLISLSLPALADPTENGHPVTVAVFGLFRPERVDIAALQNAIVTIQSGLVEVKRVLAGGQQLQVEIRGERLEIKLFEHDGRLLLTHSADAVRTEEAGCTLSVPGRIQRDFSGRLEVVVQRGRLLPRVTVQEETAVQQILRSEMADGQQPEALKAQAILARTYLRTSTGRHRKDGYDFCDTTHCQFFTDFKTADDRFRQAAITTRGLVLTFLGKAFQPLYTAACGGRTLAGFADSQPKQGSDYPYRSVSCSFCVGHPLFEWETTVKTQELLRALKKASLKDAAEIIASLAEPGEAGELGALKQATRIRVGRVLGWNVIRSNRYSMEFHSDSVQIRGHGSGHNFGLCQAGAIEMSRQGKRLSEILSFYFPGSSIEQ